MKEVKKTVGIVFIENGKLLIVQSKRSQKNNLWTLVGGGIEEGETEIEAALREVNEELGQGFEFCEEDLHPIMCFKEASASEKNIMIEMNMFLATKRIHISLIPNDEILQFHWFSIGESNYNLSSSILEHFIPYAVQKGLIYRQN